MSLGRGGGLKIQVRQDLVVLKTLPSELDESVTLELKYKNVRFQVAVVYNSHNGIKQDFVNKIDSFLSSFQKASMPAFVCGDFHIDVIRKNQLVKQYLNVHASNGFEQVVKEVIRVCEITQSCLDHFIIRRRSFGRSMFLRKFPSSFGMAYEGFTSSKHESVS